MPIGIARTVINAAAEDAPSVMPSRVRQAEVGEIALNGTSTWVSSGTFDSTGPEPNRCLIVMANLFSQNGEDNSWINNGVTAGGNAMTFVGGLIDVTSAETRSLSVGIWELRNPPSNAALSIAWDLGIAGGDILTAGHIYASLLRDVDQSAPIGAVQAVNAGTGATLDIAITTQFALSLVLGGFVSRDADSAPHSTLNGSTVILTSATADSGNSALRAATSLVEKAAASAGATSLGVTMQQTPRHGGTVAELKAA